MAALHVPEPDEMPLFQSYKACLGLIAESVDSLALPKAPLCPVQAPLGSSRAGAPVSRLESEAYCRANNLLPLSLGDQRLLACWGQGGLNITAEPGNAGQGMSWRQVSTEPVLSAMAVTPASESPTCLIVFSLASGLLAIASVDRAGESMHVSMGSVPSSPDTRIWISSASLPTPDGALSVLAHRIQTIDGRAKVELLALQLKPQDRDASSEPSAPLSITIAATWHGTALPRASYWQSAGDVMVAAMGRFEKAPAGGSCAASTSEAAPLGDSMEVSDEQEAKQPQVQAGYRSQAPPEQDTDAVIVTALSLANALPSAEASSWVLPRGELMGVAPAMSGNGGLALLLEHGRDALALNISLSATEGGVLAPTLLSQPRRIPGLASVASARRNLRLCVCSSEWTFIALCELSGSHAACVFRTPLEGTFLAPTCSASLPPDEEVIGASLSETSLCILTPHSILRFTLDASAIVPGGVPAPLTGTLPGGINAACLMKMLDKMEDD